MPPNPPKITVADCDGGEVELCPFEYEGRSFYALQAETAPLDVDGLTQLIAAAEDARRQLEGATPSALFHGWSRRAEQLAKEMGAYGVALNAHRQLHPEGKSEEWPWKQWAVEQTALRQLQSAMQNLRKAAASGKAAKRMASRGYCSGSLCPCWSEPFPRDWHRE